jgi:hypothetical protein
MIELFECWIKKRGRKRTTHFLKASEGNRERYRTIASILTEIRSMILQNRSKLAIHSTVTFAKYVYSREVADILYVCCKKYQQRAPWITFACRKSIGHSKRRLCDSKDRVQLQACVRLRAALLYLLTNLNLAFHWLCLLTGMGSFPVDGKSEASLELWLQYIEG